MDSCKIRIKQILIKKGKLNIALECTSPAGKDTTPKVRLIFTCEDRIRRLPMPIEAVENGIAYASYEYFLHYLFFGYKPKEDIHLSFDVAYGDEEYIAVPIEADTKGGKLFDINDNEIIISKDVKTHKQHFTLADFKLASTYRVLLKRPIVALLNIYYKRYLHKPVVQNRVTFISGRRNQLTGNQKFVYDKLKDNKDIDFKFLMYSDAKGHYSIRNIKAFMELYTSSRVVIIDDYFRMLNIVPKRKEVCLIQLWHACGAFKTFGFTRLGKDGGPRQRAKNHRMYDYAIVSSKNVAKHYAEGFGVSDQSIIPTGVPRTDIFMDEEYGNKVKADFYTKYPQLKGKRIMLFAPTFRGMGQMTANYPIAKFNPQQVYDALGEEYAIIIKLHPFCKEKYNIDEKYKDVILDLGSKDELNDLLFVTDLLVTDYSSAVFEASLLNIPMLFYAYDLEEYIADRDFYFDFKSFVPGKIVASQDELVTAVASKDFDAEKISAFKNKFFDEIDGQSSQRVADKILEILEDK